MPEFNEQAFQQGFQNGLLFGALLAGALCGFVPLITGVVKKRIVLGIIGFVFCMIGSLFLGILLALPFALIFTLIINKKSTSKVFTAPPEPPVFK